jgi:hypothetical protein
MKFLFLAILLASCATQVKYPDRSENQEMYEEQEQKNLKKSLNRSEVMALVQAMDTRIRAVDAQIKTQQNVIKRYEAEGLASSKAMIENANIRISHLQGERASLVEEKEKLKGNLSE